MKSLGEIFKGLMGGKPKMPEGAPVDAEAQRLASLTAAQGNVEAQAVAQGIATPAATPEAAPAQPVVATPTPLK